MAASQAQEHFLCPEGWEILSFRKEVIPKPSLEGLSKNEPSKGRWDGLQLEQQQEQCMEYLGELYAAWV